MKRRLLLASLAVAAFMTCRFAPSSAWDDNVHPNAAGYRAMGEFVDLALFSTGRLPK